MPWNSQAGGRIVGVLYVTLDKLLPGETGITLYVWVSGARGYQIVRRLVEPNAQFPNVRGSGQVVRFAGTPAVRVPVDFEVGAELARPDVSIGVALACDWSLRDLASRTRSVVGVCTIPAALATAAAGRGSLPLGFAMIRVDSQHGCRAAAAFQSSSAVEGAALDGAVRIAETARSALVRARAISHRWIEYVQTSMERMAEMPGTPPAVVRSRVASWQTHIGDIPPEVYFAPRYPASLFTADAFARALERARFVTGCVERERVLAWCATANRPTDPDSPGAMLCACVLLGRMLASFAQMLVFTPDVVLLPDGKTEHVDHFVEPLFVAAGDCDETAKLTIAACLAFQRMAPTFAEGTELAELAAIARTYVFAVVLCHVPLGAGSAAGTALAQLDEVDRSVNCSAHFTVIGLPAEVYQRACAGNAGDAALARSAAGKYQLPPSLTIDGAGFVHPVLAIHRQTRGWEYAVREGGPTIVVAAEEHMREVDATIAPLAGSPDPAVRQFCLEYMTPARDTPDRCAFYRAFVHMYTWPVVGLPRPFVHCRASFTTPGRRTNVLGASARAVAGQRDFGIMKWPNMPPIVQTAARLLERHLPPADNFYLTAFARPVHVPSIITGIFGQGGCWSTCAYVSRTILGMVPGQHEIVLSIGLSNLPTGGEDLTRALTMICNAVLPDSRRLGDVGAVCMVNSLGPDRGELLVKFIVTPRRPR